jgi:Ethanolamine utilization protein EutJ (predicted chaperonin)
MDNQRRIEKLREQDYQELFGVRKPTFDKMLAILERVYEELHVQGGRPSRLSVLESLSSHLAITMTIELCKTSLLITACPRAVSVMP